MVCIGITTCPDEPRPAPGRILCNKVVPCHLEMLTAGRWGLPDSGRTHFIDSQVDLANLTDMTG